MITNLYPNPYQPQRATFNRQQMRALAADHEVNIVAPIAWTDELSARVRGENRFTRGRGRTLDGIAVLHPRYYYPPGMLRSRYGQFYLWSVGATVRAMAKTFKPDILLASWAYPDGYATVQLAEKMNLPAAVQVVGSDVNLLSQYPSRSHETWNTLRSADAVIAVSQDLMKQVIGHGVDRDRVSVVYGGVDRNRFYPGSQREAQRELRLAGTGPILLFVGNLVPVKAVDVLLTACSRLVKAYPQLQCHLIGDGRLRKKLQHQAAALSLENQLQFHGVVEHSQLPTWYRAADLVVLPSLAEGVPNVLLEAIACGRPYVASRTGGIPEISAHPGCILVTPGDPEALARAISRKLENRTSPTPSLLPVSSWADSGRALGQVLENCCKRARSSH